MIAVPVRPFKSSSLEEVIRLLKLDKAAMANDVLSSAVVANEDPTEWLTALVELSQNSEDKSLPRGIDPELLLAIGVPIVDTADSYRKMIADALMRVEDISLDELQGHAAENNAGEMELDIEEDETWDINHTLNILIIDRAEPESLTTIGSAGYMYLDWLPGTTSFIEETSRLRHARVILNAYAIKSEENIAEGNLHSAIIDATVKDGKLIDVILADEPTF